MAILPDGKILTGGSANDNLALCRFNRDGSLDTTWGQQGMVTVDLLGYIEHVRTLTLQSDGKILVEGFAVVREQFQNTFITRSIVSFVARLTRTGEVDNTFGKDGAVNFPSIGAMAIQPDGNIVIAGVRIRTTGQNPATDFELTRLINSDVPKIIEVRFDPAALASRSWTATFSGSNLNEETCFDIRFLPPNSNTEQVALNWQRGISASHSLPPGTTAGIWRVTGVRPHQDANDHNSEFLLTAATLTVN